MRSTLVDKELSWDFVVSWTDRERVIQ